MLQKASKVVFKSSHGRLAIKMHEGNVVAGGGGSGQSVPNTFRISGAIGGGSGGAPASRGNSYGGVGEFTPAPPVAQAAPLRLNLKLTNPKPHGSGKPSGGPGKAGKK